MLTSTCPVRFEKEKHQIVVHDEYRQADVRTSFQYLLEFVHLQVRSRRLQDPC
jgi:hypothetical protein